MKHAVNMDLAAYDVITRRQVRVSEEDSIIRRALEILHNRTVGKVAYDVFGSPNAVKQYLTLRLSEVQHEVFGVLWLDAQNRGIGFDILFRGTLTQTSVYPREVMKMAMQKNAASVILFHNHPSGAVQPSRADEELTQTLKSSLAFIDVRVMDHIIVGGMDTLSMAERGLL